MRRREQRQRWVGHFLAELLEGRLLLSLPAGWVDGDIGSPPVAGSATYNSSSNIFSISGSGNGPGGTADQLHFTYYPMTGSGSVIALLNSQTNTNANAKAGVMIRSDTSAGSLFAAVDQTAQNLIEFEWRSGSVAVSSPTVTITAPVWLKVSEQGNNFSGYYSTDGAQWVQIGATQTIAMPSATVDSGIWDSSNNSSALNTANFSSVSVVRGGWSDNDVGAPAFGGSAVYDSPSDTTTILGNGADIFGTADQFNFNSTSMTGDGSAIAFVDSITNTNAWAKAGVMVRNDLTAGSAFTALLVSPTNGITFEFRTTSGGVTNQEISSPAGGPTPAPVGLKLTRSGNSFSAFYCTDGINWISVGPSQTVALNSTALAGLAVTSHNTGALCMAAFSSVSIGTGALPAAGIYSTTDQLFLNDLENRELLSFYNETNPNTGLVPDNVNANGGNPSAYSSIAAIGFALSALTVADARGWLSHAAAYQRALNTISFLYNSGANNNGFFYHFLNETTGARFGTSEVSSVDTAELMSGVLNAAQYWSGTPLQTTALAMFDRVNWPWMQQSNGIFYGAWTPESGFSGGYGDYSEASLLYLLSLGSPTHPTTQASWLAWSRTPVEHYSTYTYVDADDNALFTVQYPMAWFNLQGLTDSKGLNYYQNAQTATLAQRQWMIDLSSTSSTYADYGPNLWGLSPAEGGGSSQTQGTNNYTIWGGPPANVPVDGTVVPTAAGGSLEFDPRYTINVLENMKQTYGSTVYQKYGLVDAFNPRTGWTSTLVLGIDIGMTLLAAENSRSNLIWNVFDQSSIAQQALAKAFVSSAKSVWIPSTSADWNAKTSWANATVPNSTSAEADFFGAIGASHTAFTDVGVTVGTINFNNTNTYVIAGAGSITLQSSSGTANLIVQSGTQEIDLPITIASNTIFNVAAGATLIIANPMTINAGMTLTETGGGTVVFESTVNLQSGAGIVIGNSTTLAGLNMQNSSDVTISPHGGALPAVVQVNDLSMTDPSGDIVGRLDVSNDDLIIHDGNLSTITAELQAGFNAGQGYWNGSAGILSTAAAGDPRFLTTIGSRQADGNPFDGVSTSTSDVLVKYTLYGDANLDGQLNGADYQQIDNGFGSHLTGWQNGDFNYDGVVNGSDFALIDNAFNQETSALASTTAQASFVAPVHINAVFAAPAASFGGVAITTENVASAIFDAESIDPRKRHLH